MKIDDKPVQGMGRLKIESSMKIEEENTESNMEIVEEDEEDNLTLYEFTRFRALQSSTTTSTPIMVPFEEHASDFFDPNSRKGNLTNYHKAKGRATACSLSDFQKASLSDYEKANAKALAKELAREVQANLDARFPSFVKSLVLSQVSIGYWMGLPTHFCKNNLPKENVILTLVDENQKEFSVAYNAERTMLRTGWKLFCVTHKLVPGDALVFQLVKPTEFQVYIRWAYDMAKNDWVIGLQNSHASQQQNDWVLGLKSSHGNGMDGNGVTEKECCQTRSVLIQQPVDFPSNSKEVTPEVVEHSRSNEKEVGPEMVEHSRSSSEEVSPEVMELDGIRFTETTVKFKDTETLESFSIVVNGVVIDSEFSEEQRSKYYELCCSQKSFLHDNLFNGINYKLVSGVISLVISIADAIKASKISTSKDVFEKWDTNLEAVEVLGMNVGFLRARIKELVSLDLGAENGEHSKKCRASINRKDRMIKEIRSFNKKILKLEEACKRIATEIEMLELEARENEVKFQSVAVAPW